MRYHTATQRGTIVQSDCSDAGELRPKAGDIWLFVIDNLGRVELQAQMTILANGDVGEAFNGEFYDKE